MVITAIWKFMSPHDSPDYHSFATKLFLKKPPNNLSNSLGPNSQKLMINLSNT